MGLAVVCDLFVANFLVALGLETIPWMSSPPQRHNMLQLAIETATFLHASVVKEQEWVGNQNLSSSKYQSDKS